MEHCTKKPGEEKEIPAFGPDCIELSMRLRIRDTIEALEKEDLESAFGAPKSARLGEQRHGTRERTVTNSLGPAAFAMPGARIAQADGTRGE